MTLTLKSFKKGYMSNHTTLNFKTTSDIDVIDITSDAQEFVSTNGIKDGALLVFTNGSTASVSTIEYEPGLVKDIKIALKKLFPPDIDYYHHQTWNDGNGYSHVMSTIMKPSITVPIIDGRLTLGTWQQIILLDFDNKNRRREVILKLL